MMKKEKILDLTAKIFVASVAASVAPFLGAFIKSVITGKDFLVVLNSFFLHTVHALYVVLFFPVPFFLILLVVTV